MREGCIGVGLSQLDPGGIHDVLSVSYQVHTAGNTDLARSIALPDLPRTPTWKPPLADQVGEAVHDHSWLMLAGSGIAALGAGLLTRGLGGGLLASVGAGVLGAIGGALGVAKGSALLGRNDHEAPSADGLAKASTSVTTREQVKVMTYNLHGGMGGPKAFGCSEAELDALAEVIRRERPDVLMLQEVDQFSARSNYVDVMDELARRLGADSAVGAAPGRMATGRYQQVGVMTFNGFRIDNARNIIGTDSAGPGTWRRTLGTVTGWRKTITTGVLHRSFDEASGTAPYMPRNALDSIVVTPEGNQVRVLSGHFSSNRRNENLQEEESLPLAARLDAWDGPTLLGADFNIRSGNADGAAEATAFGRAGLVDAFTAIGMMPGDQRRASIDNDEEVVDIDRIYASGHFSVEDVHVVHEDGATASDHRPVVATVTLQPNAAP